jgi:nicotinamide-nucleotide adenylyltransferase
LEKSKISNYRIVLIPDIHNPPKWVAHVLSIVNDFDVVLTTNALTKRLFKEKGFTVKETPIFDRNNYSGKEIRRRIAHGEQWEDLVPEPVTQIITDIDGVHRIKDLAN